MDAKQYCISLEMAKRDDLQAAMEAAGCTSTARPYSRFDPDYWHYDGRGPDAGKYELARADGPEQDIGNCVMYPAWSLGELWVAAQTLAAKLDETDYQCSTLNLCAGITIDSQQAYGVNEDDNTIFFETTTTTPDALAQLVISLHAASQRPDDASGPGEGGTD